MKKLLIFSFLFVMLGMTVSAQVQYKSFAADTIAADTSVYLSNRAVDKYTSTVVSFVFTKADIADSLSVAKLQGSMDNSTWIDLADATANLTNTSTDGTSILYVTNPIFLYYRGFLACASGDSVDIPNAWFVIKED